MAIGFIVAWYVGLKIFSASGKRRIIKKPREKVILFEKLLQSLLRIGLVLFMAGCAPSTNAPTPIVSTPSISPPTPTMLPAQNTPDPMATVKLVMQPPSGNDSGVEGLAFDPNAGTLASIYQNGEIVLWDLNTNQLVRSFMGEGGTGGLGIMPGLSFDPDGKSLVSNSRSNGLTITLWDITTGKSLEVEKNLSHGDGMALSPDGRLLAYGKCAELDAVPHCIQYEIVLWDVAAQQPTGQSFNFNVGAAAPLWLMFSPDGNTLTVMSSATTGSGALQLFDVNTLQPTASPLEGKGRFTSMTFSPSGEYMALGNDTGVIHLWDLKSHDVLSQLVGETGLITGLTFSPDGKALASKILVPSDDPKEKVLIWDLDTSQTIDQPLNGQAASGKDVGLISMAFSPDGSILATGTDEGAIILWNFSKNSGNP